MDFLKEIFNERKTNYFLNAYGGSDFEHKARSMAASGD
jgi:hypothetical protein